MNAKPVALRRSVTGIGATPRGHGGFHFGHVSRGILRAACPKPTSPRASRDSQGRSLNKENFSNAGEARVVGLVSFWTRLLFELGSESFNET